MLYALRSRFCMRDHVVTAKHEAIETVRQRYVAQLTRFCIFGCDLVSVVNPKKLFLRSAFFVLGGSDAIRLLNRSASAKNHQKLLECAAY